MSRVKTETRSLMCHLTEHELLERGDELAKTYMEIAALDMQKKRIAAQIKPKDERIEQLVVIIDTKEEERRVDCEWHYEWGAGVKKLIRMDTGAVVDTGEIKDWERQQHLPIEESTQLVDAVDVPLPGAAEEHTPLTDDPQEPAAEVCVNTDCPNYGAQTANGCSTLEHVFECESVLYQVKYETAAGISLCATCKGECNDFTPGTQVSECAGYCGELTEDQIAWRDGFCKTWRDCGHADLCYGPANETTDCVCISDAMKVKEATEPATALTFQQLVPWGFSANEAKILAAGFHLVKYDRGEKSFQITSGDPRSGWTAKGPFKTCVTTEREVDALLDEPLYVQVAGNDKSTVGAGSAKLKNAGFEFYRVEGIIPGHGTPRIKYGSNWKTWKKFDAPEECKAAWEELLSTNPKALED